MTFFLIALLISVSADFQFDINDSKSTPKCLEACMDSTCDELKSERFKYKILCAACPDSFEENNEKMTENIEEDNEGDFEETNQQSEIVPNDDIQNGFSDNDEEENEENEQEENEKEENENEKEENENEKEENENEKEENENEKEENENEKEENENEEIIEENRGQSEGEIEEEPQSDSQEKIQDESVKINNGNKTMETPIENEEINENEEIDVENRLKEKNNVENRLKEKNNEEKDKNEEIDLVENEEFVETNLEEFDENEIEEGEKIERNIKCNPEALDWAECHERCQNKTCTEIVEEGFSASGCFDCHNSFKCNKLKGAKRSLLNRFFG